MAALDIERFSRQLVLGEIGAAGQARLEAARVRVDAPSGGAGLAAETARRYLAAAGVQVVDGACELVFTASEVAGPAEAMLAGAALAADAMKRVLGVGAPLEALP